MEGTSPPSERDADRVGPSPAPGSGHPATKTRLGRAAIVAIIVVGLLWLAGWIAWAIFVPDIEIHYHHHPDRHHDHPDRHHDGIPGGGGRLTAIPGPTVG
jgi:hypothetical protein